MSDKCPGLPASLLAPDQHRPWFRSEKKEKAVTQKSLEAYRLYSLFYPVLALLAYKLIWRGKLLRHIRFFRNSLYFCSHPVDIATGDGTLTKKALFPLLGRGAESVIAIDISPDMLKKAVKNLPPEKVTLVEGDAENLDFALGSVRLFTCFGGFNSFLRPVRVLLEFRRCLEDGGRVRGSVLLTPEGKRRTRAIDCFISWGLQSMHVSRQDFLDWVRASGLFLKTEERHGDVLLFELVKV